MRLEIIKVLRIVKLVHIEATLRASHFKPAHPGRETLNFDIFKNRA
jgi:hypothetical protein